MSDFIDHMQCKAERIAKLMEAETRKSNRYCNWDAWPHGCGPGKPNNIKPWYNNPEVFAKPAKRAFIGIMPGGEPDNPDITTIGHPCKAPEWHMYNLWICEDWEFKEHQEWVLKAFEALYDGSDEGIRILLETPSFNICPIRTGGSDAEHMPPKVWDQSAHWAKKVLYRMRPKTIIMDGNGQTSPWSAMKKFGLRCTHEPVEVAPNGFLKQGVMQFDDRHTAQVIAFPSLARRQFRDPRLLDELSKLNPI